jgi:two-component system, NtrC family, C4-dicarboxylate transport sensor histidine kinase DctB
MLVTRRTFIAVLTALSFAGFIALLGSRWADTRARAATDAAAAGLAHSHAVLLASELQKFRLLPLVLAERPDMARAMAPDGRTAADEARTRLNRALELLAVRTDAAVIYAIDRRGRTVAASNWRLPTSFVGQDYGFRPYFVEAMRRGAAELFALGTVSGRPGLYLARRVDTNTGPMGVIVVKVEFDALEASWRRAPAITAAVDAHGVVLVTSRSAWRFAATEPIDATTLADARRTLQFGSGPPARAPYHSSDRDALVEEGGNMRPYRIASEPVPLAGGRVLVFMPNGPARAAARTEALLWAAGLMLVLGAAGAVVLRFAESRRLQHQARSELEAEVVRRTAELRHANERLIIESEERAEAERRFRAAREELAQANRLGSLGQIVAGVAHEINQPVAAIRTYAENGAVLLDRSATDRARDNLLRIVGLADRVGAITAEMRAFARRRTPAVGAVRLGDVLDGVRLLMGERRGARVGYDVPADLRSCRIVGDRTRLEQVLVNLVQNAFDAVDGGEDGVITVEAALADAEHLALRVVDNGPGVPSSLRDTLYTPFTSGKPEGLGLGLAIARDIARAFGGDLVLEDSPAGASFVFTVRVA